MKTLEAHKLQEIIALAARGDRKSQQFIFEYLYGKMIVVCLRYTNNDDEAKDILQEGYLKVFDQLKSFTLTGSFEGWVRRIMTNTAIDYYRKRKRDKIVYAQDDYLYDLDAVQDQSGEEDFLVDPQYIVKELQDLSPAYRLVFNLYVVEGYSHKEIAETLGISEGTSKSNLSKAKDNLKKRLEKYIK